MESTQLLEIKKRVAESGMNSPLKCVSTGETLKESKGRKDNLTRSSRLTPKKQAQISEVPRRTRSEIRLCLNTEWHPAFRVCYYWIPAAKWKTQTALETLTVYSILIIPVQTSAVSLYGAPREKKRKRRLIVSTLLALHPCCISWRAFQERGADLERWDQSLLLRHTKSSAQVGAASCPAAGWEQPAHSSPASKHEPILGLRHHFNPDSLSPWSHNSAAICCLHRQASVTALPRFEEMFDTIVSSNSTFNYWSESPFPSESCRTFFNLCHFLFKFLSDFVSSEGRIKLSLFLGMHRLCDKIHKQFWSSVKCTATQYCSLISRKVKWKLLYGGCDGASQRLRGDSCKVLHLMDGISIFIYGSKRVWGFFWKSFRQELTGIFSVSLTLEE